MRHKKKQSLQFFLPAPRRSIDQSSTTSPDVRDDRKVTYRGLLSGDSRFPGKISRLDVSQEVLDAYGKQSNCLSSTGISPQVLARIVCENCRAKVRNYFAKPLRQSDMRGTPMIRTCSETSGDLLKFKADRITASKRSRLHSDLTLSTACRIDVSRWPGFPIRQYSTILACHFDRGRMFKNVVSSFWTPC